jgi:hypothetical protein
LCALKLLLRPLSLAIGSLQFFLSAFTLVLGALQILLSPLVIRLRLLQRLFGPFAIGVRRVEILLAALALGLCAVQILQRSRPFGQRPRQLVLRALTIGIRVLAFRLHPFEIGLSPLEVRLGARPFGVKTFDIGPRAVAFRGHGFVELPFRVDRCVRGRLFGLHPSARDLGSECALDVGARRGDFRFEPGSPLGVRGVELLQPPLLRVSVSALTRFVQRLLMGLGEVAKLFELRLQPGANTVDDSAKMFLGHLLALCEARSH